MSKEKVMISFSGGRTSGYMTKRLLDEYSDLYDFIVVFANTGQEHEETLKFVNNCDTLFGFNTIWVEAVVNPNAGEGIRHRIVTFETAARKGEPYEDLIKKYGIPNVGGPFCSERMKRYPIESYMKSIGLHTKDYQTAIGIRTDETRRISKAQEKRNIIYPLIDMFPSDKQDVLDWWEDQIFDLEVPEGQGNCIWCWKKSINKLIKIMDVNQEAFDFPDRMEKTYGFVDMKKKLEVPMKFFRNGHSTASLRKLHKEIDAKNLLKMTDLYANDGCSESCEIYSMEGDKNRDE